MRSLIHSVMLSGLKSGIHFSVQTSLVHGSVDFPLFEFIKSLSMSFWTFESYSSQTLYPLIHGIHLTVLSPWVVMTRDCLVLMGLQMFSLHYVAYKRSIDMFESHNLPRWYGSDGMHCSESPTPLSPLQLLAVLMLCAGPRISYHNARACSVINLCWITFSAVSLSLKSTQHSSPQNQLHCTSNAWLTPPPCHGCHVVLVKMHSSSSASQPKLMAIKWLVCVSLTSLAACKPLTMWCHSGAFIHECSTASFWWLLPSFSFTCGGVSSWWHIHTWQWRAHHVMTHQLYNSSQLS